MKSVIVFLAVWMVFIQSWGFSVDETNAVVHAMLERAMDLLGGDTPADLEGKGGRTLPFTWQAFLGGNETNGWSATEKKDAFDWYLKNLGTVDFSHSPVRERQMVRMAVLQCRLLGYSEAASPLRALALNPEGVSRGLASEVAMSLGGLDGDTEVFVETVMTNKSCYSRMERGNVIGLYAQRLLDNVSTNSVDSQNRDSGIHMLYRHRMFDVAGANIMDTLFVAGIDGYGQSSNRLAHAQFVLSHPEHKDHHTRKFSVVTNQLLSSGQPLRQLNIGATISCD